MCRDVACHHLVANRDARVVEGPRLRGEARAAEGVAMTPATTEEQGRILVAVCQLAGISPRYLVSASKANAPARSVVCWLLRKRCRLSYPKIGEVVKRDHTTVMAACDRVDEALACTSPRGDQAIRASLARQVVGLLELDPAEPARAPAEVVIRRLRGLARHALQLAEEIDGEADVDARVVVRIEQHAARVLACGSLVAGRRAPRVDSAALVVRQKEQGPERVASLEAPDSSGVGGRDR
jgi:hypothetical protein